VSEKMNPEAKTIWIDALRSDRYQQARGSFIDVAPHLEGETKQFQHCCLAVLTHEAADRQVPGVRWTPEAEDIMIVCLWDAHEEAWRQPGSPDEAEDWMTGYPEIDPTASYEARQHDGWAWVGSNSVTDGDLPRVIVGWAGLGDANPAVGEHDAIDLNDGVKLSFAEIADRVEQYL